MTWIGIISRFGIAILTTGLLLVFLIVSQWIRPSAKILTLRSVEGIESVSMPAPPPPPPVEKSQPTPPPPTAAMELPKLDLSIDDLAPPIEATLAENKLDLEMKPTEFSAAFQPPKARSLYASTDLDNQPRLLNRPAVTFPPGLRRQGILDGKVILEVLINAGGRVSVRRVISSSHPDFIPMAKSFASRARFSPPKKDGRIVNAVFNWPLVLKP